MPLEAEYSGGATLRALADGTRVLSARSADGRPVAIKVLASGHAAHADAARLRNEYEIGHRLDCPGVLHPLTLGTWSGRTALVLEWFDGQPLDTLLGSSMPIERFLVLAEGIARALGDLHSEGVVHRDIKPENILVGAAGGEVKLSGLGIASQLPGCHVRGGALIEGSLAYMSPEQTGRTSRRVDHRSDLYSLGVTFYEILSGQLPFDAKDPLEWLHCHIARSPPPLTTVAPSVPPALAAIVMKLLSKLTDERYQGARGLLHDLEKCRQRLAATGCIEPFILGADDVPEQFQIPQRLYGRERETAALLSAFAQVAEGGGPHLLLVNGGAGSGKSRLVYEAEETILRAGGSLISGKFDQQKPDIPYSTFVQAFREVVLEVLTETDERLAAFRQRLLSALGVNAQLIVDVIPELELVIGSQPPVVELPPAEAQNRFRIVFRQFISVFAQEGHPLTVFLDDLQWADAASLAFLEGVLTQPEMRHLFVIGAYRDSEVDGSHALSSTLSKLRDAGRHVPCISLGPLSNGHLGVLIGDALHCSPEDAAPLAEVVHRKTAGNPFFVVQFLSALHDERLIELDDAAKAWRWDVAKIRAKSFTDNVVDLMVAKLKRRAATTRTALEHLACLGSSADLATLAMVYGRTEEETQTALEEAVAAGLLALAGDTYRFVHDRIQEAAYSLVPEGSRAAAHLRIGRLLAAHLPSDAAGGRIFDIVNQQNRGISLIVDAEERESLCRLNFRAGLKAKAAIAYASAQTYFRQATELLAPNAWDARYDETFALYLALSECEYLVGQFDRADELFGLLLERARDNADRAKACILRMRLYQLAGRHDDGVTVMVDALRGMGVSFPDSDEAIAAALEEQRDVVVNLRGRRIADLVDAPAATDPEVRAIIGLYVAAIPCANVGRPQVLPLIVVRALNCALKHGNTEDACFAYGAYGALLVALFSDIPSGFEFSEMAIRLNEKRKDVRWRGHLLYVYADFIHCWGRPFATVREALDKVPALLLEVGDLLVATYHVFHSIWMSVERGDTLDETLDLVSEYGAIAKESHSDFAARPIAVQRQLLRCLKGATKKRASLDGDGFDEADCVTVATQSRLGTLAAYFHIAKQIVCFIYGRYDEALSHADAAAPLLGAVMATPIEATHHFYLALTLAALDAERSGDKKKEHRARLDGALSKLRYWATSCPENYQNRYALVAAEVARLEGRDRDAMRLYEEAIRSAQDHGLVQNEALAFERASAYYRASGFDRFADTYLREARARYARWGASGKVAELDERFPDLAHAIAATPGALDAAAADPGSTFAARTELFDLHSIVEALQTISGAIVLDDLVRTLLRIVLEQGGAQRATLLLADERGRLSALAEAEATDAGLAISRDPKRPASRNLPQGIIDYVWRTGERVLLDDASGRSRFSADEYVAKAKPRSVLCLPIVRQAKTVGLLYLENNLVTNAFTQSRLSVLELLASQAAISLENARLYADLERENAERTTAERAMRESEERFRLLVDGVKDSALFMLDRQGCVASWNVGAARLFGYSADEIRGRASACLYTREDALRGAPEHALARASADGSFEQDGFRQRKDRSTFFSDFVVTALHDERGELTTYSVLVRDLTQRFKLEEMVRQAQKMEAVGRLAGGVAHDFNNLLGAIYGLVHQGLKRLTPHSPVASDLEQIREAAQKAGELTKQLLAFARKQRVETRVFDLNDLVRSMERLLRRVLGDHIELTTVTSPRLDPVEADPGQIEQVVLNLAVNARDAMPRGGILTIETSSVDLGEEYAARHAGVTPGPFAMLAISDTGSGMTAEVLEHIFEPFFTTKGPGEGTGLGLATSYGIVKQAGGHIWVYSEDGRGTTFKIYLPRSSKEASAALPAPVSAPGSNGETLLLVEDHATLRKLVARGLESVGYQVISAASGDEAIRMAEAHATPIDLLITDLVMPKMSGHELASRLEAGRPSLKVLCVSGYTETSLVGDSKPGPRTHFLSKPFTPDELAKKVRDVLDGAATPDRFSG
jgi:PAS domain S-box-containing protein